MFKTLVAAALGLTASVLACAACAGEDAGAVLRLIGEAPALGPDGPAHFAIDARVTREAGETHSEVKGWLTTLPPQSQSGEVEGSCVGKSCELSVDLTVHKLTLSGQILDLSGKTEGEFKTSDNDPATPLPASGAVSFTPFVDTAPGLGELVKPDAISSRELDDLLLWTGVNPAFGDDDAHPIEDFQREHLVSWQQQNERPMTGLLTTADLALLTTQRAAAQKTAGWVVLGAPGLGWSAGYPAALLPKASRAGVEQRFASADGAASLVVAIDPPLTNDDFDALVEKLIHNPGAGRASNGYTRTGPDMQISYVEADKAISEVYYNRPAGLARLIFAYPNGQNAYADIDATITYSLKITGDLKPAP